MIQDVNISSDPEQLSFLRKSKSTEQVFEENIELPIGVENLSLEEGFSFNQLIELLSAGYALKIMEMLESQEMQLKKERV